MLHKETVSATTLGLLKTLMEDKLLEDFFLVGGTALSLQIGHRISMDLDLLTQTSFDNNAILSNLEEHYKLQTDFQARNILKGSIDGIKVDLITHNYPLVRSLIRMEGIRMAAPEDIAAMKLNAITGNGTRLKDFIDIAYLSSLLTLSQMNKYLPGKVCNEKPGDGN